MKAPVLCNKVVFMIGVITILLVVNTLSFGQDSCQTCPPNTTSNAIVQEYFDSGTYTFDTNGADANKIPSLISTTGLTSWGNYAVTNQNASAWNPQWFLDHDHTASPNNYYLLCDGYDKTSTYLFRKTNVPVVHGRTYIFCAWFANVTKSNIADIDPSYTHVLPKFEMRINGQIDNSPLQLANGQFWVPKSVTWVAPNDNPATLEIVLATKGGIGNDVALDDITFRECKPRCTCGEWGGPANIVWIGPSGTRNENINCGTTKYLDTVCQGKQIILKLGIHNCSIGDCPLQYSFKLSGPPPFIGMASPWSNVHEAPFVPLVPGTYTLLAGARCGDTICPDTCRITVVVKTISSCETCRCMGWDPANIVWVGPSGTMNQSINCNTTKYLDTICQRKPIKLTISYKCSKPCSPQYSFKLSGPSPFIPVTSLWSSTHEAPFVPPVAGTYTLLARARCDSTQCPDTCRITVVVGTISSCETCKCMWDPANIVWVGPSGTMNQNISCNTTKYLDTVCQGKPIKLVIASECSIGCSLQYSFLLSGPPPFIGIASPWSGVHEAPFVPPVPGTYTLLARARCGDTKCDTCRITVVVGTISSCETCKCMGWDPANIVWVDASGARNQSINCNTTQYLGAICQGKPIKLTISYKCSRPCSPQYSFKLSGPSPFIPVASLWSSSHEVPFVPLVPGTYTLLANARCDGTKCLDSCKITVVVRRIIPCGTCECKNWSSTALTITYKGETGQVASSGLKCNDSTTFEIPYVCVGSSITVAFGNYLCSPLSCAAKYSCQVTGPSGNLFYSTNVTSAQFSFPAPPPTQIGVYTISIVPGCGDNKCEPCRIKINIKKIGGC